MLEAGWERGSEHASHWAAGPTPGTPAPPRRRKPVLRVVGEADRPLAGAGGTGRDAGLLVSRKGVIAEEKAEQPLENQAGTASVSLLLREPWAAVAARPWRARGRHPQGSSPRTGKARLPGDSAHHYPLPQTCRAGLTRVIHDVLLPWAPITYKKARTVVATKQNTDANMTQPWIRGIGTWDEETRIHTSPPKTCRGRERRGDGQTRKARPRGYAGEPGHCTNTNSVHPHSVPSVGLTHV